MSVVNKMLKDLDNRAASGDADDADYQEPPESRRIRYMIFFIAFIGVSAAGYFSYRTLGHDYFMDLYAQAEQFVTGEEPVQQQSKRVSVNSALDQMMPSRGNINTAETESTPADDAKPEASTTDDTQQEVANEGGESASTELANNAQQVSGAEQTSDRQEGSTATVPAEQTTQVAQESTSSEVRPMATLPGQTVVPALANEASFVQVSNAGSEDTEIAELRSQAAQAVADENVDEAINLYRKILNIDFKQHEIRKKLAVLLYSNGNNGAASVVLSDGVDIAPQRTDFRLMLARLFYREKKLRAAYTVLEGVDPDVQRNIDFYGLKATVAQELELNAEASHLYGRLVIFEPKRAQWWLGLAISLDRLSQRDGALRAYENAADLRQLSASATDFIRQRIIELGG